MNIFALLFFILLHWALILSTSLYVFIRESRKYDMVYFTLICTLFTSWLFTGKECLISYWERLSIDPTYVYGSEPFRHLFLDLAFTPTFSLAILLFICALNVYNLYIMLAIYDVPIPIRVSLFCFLLYPSIKSRIKSYVKNGTFESKSIINK